MVLSAVDWSLFPSQLIPVKCIGLIWITPTLAERSSRTCRPPCRAITSARLRAVLCHLRDHFQLRLFGLRVDELDLRRLHDDVLRHQAQRVGRPFRPAKASFRFPMNQSGKLVALAHEPAAGLAAPGHAQRAADARQETAAHRGLRSPRGGPRRLRRHADTPHRSGPHRRTRGRTTPSSSATVRLQCDRGNDAQQVRRRRPSGNGVSVRPGTSYPTAHRSDRRSLAGRLP
jgi:hypothetical protein